ncbi:MAG: hypothetical protein HRT57_10500 [Crocinitomicaceae bacterium]|nr:hypothetical protein [Crocinitomicaceae bacterium]
MKSKLTHEEVENKACLSPQDRANFYGAPNSYYVGENVVYASYNASVRVKGRTFERSTYKKMARCLVYSWIKSRGHFKNMINPDYQVTGLSIGIDTTQNVIYSCKKFARVMYAYSFDENPEMFPYAEVNRDSVNALLVAVSENRICFQYVCRRRTPYSTISLFVGVSFGR